MCMPLEQWFFSLASHPLRSIFKNRPVEPIHTHWHLLKLQDRERGEKKVLLEFLHLSCLGVLLLVP